MSMSKLFDDFLGLDPGGGGLHKAEHDMVNLDLKPLKWMGVSDDPADDIMGFDQNGAGAVKRANKWGPWIAAAFGGYAAAGAGAGEAGGLAAGEAAGGSAAGGGTAAGESSPVSSGRMPSIPSIQGQQRQQQASSSANDEVDEYMDEFRRLSRESQADSDKRAEARMMQIIENQDKTNGVMK